MAAYKYLVKNNIDCDSLNETTESSLDMKLCENQFTNGLVIDLYNLCKNKNFDVSRTVPKWTAEILHFDISEISSSALVSKIHRTIKLSRDKRGARKEEFLDNKFSVPTNTVVTAQTGVHGSKPRSQMSLKDACSLTKTEQQLQERRLKVRELTEKNKQLKRKFERITEKQKNETDIKKARVDELSDVRTELKNTKKSLNSLKKSSKVLELQKEKLRKLNREKTLKIKNLENQIKSDQAKLSSIKSVTCEDNTTESAIENLQKQVKEANCSIDYLQSLLDDSKDIPLFDEVQKKYSNETFQCVMNLTDLKVPTEKVGNVIKEVMSLCGKQPNAVPSASTVNRIVDSKLAVAHKQISDVLLEKKNTTLYTDETKKYGKCIQTYVLTDEDQTSYILGLREMFNKSGQSTLDTLKEILEDIGTHCYQKERENHMNVGYRILANIRDTMSDRASTEKNFNHLLEDFRASILSQVVDNWDNMDEDQKKLCSRLNNFFCGLHLLVGMADSCEASLKKFESEFKEDMNIGSAAKPELKRYHRNESGTVRLIRTSSKAFAVGEDEKNGVSLQWRTHLQQKGEKNHIIRFKHNRFNLVFLLGQAVYFHHEDISHFLGAVHGTDNDLLKAVLLDSQETLYIAGVKALGLISKFISAPLWRILEEKGHILEMNERYKLLVDFLQKAATDEETASEFITGETTPFNTQLDMDDKLFKFLITPNESIDKIAIPLIQNLFQSISDLLCRMVSDHLPGGRYWNPTAEVIADTKSVMKHNKLPEFVFGQLDQLLRYRPNATLLTNESFIIYSHNRTRQWFDSLSEDAKDKLIEEARKEGKELRKTFHKRLKAIEERRILAQKKRQEELRERERKRLQKAENLTNDVCFYGLWQSQEQVTEALGILQDKDKRTAIEAQLKFRKVVLKQKHVDKKIYNLSRKNEKGKYVKLSTDELKTNLLSLIHDTLKAPTEEHQRGQMPLLVGKNIAHRFSDNITYEGFVISVVPGFSEWYNVKYKDDKAIYAYNLYDDYTKGDLKIVVSSTCTN